MEEIEVMDDTFSIEGVKTQLIQFLGNLNPNTYRVEKY